jgi:hypothetical protein
MIYFQEADPLLGLFKRNLFLIRGRLSGSFF